MLDSRYLKLGIGNTEFCNRCRKESGNEQFLSHPLPYWHIGKNFQEDDERILLIGKVARGNPGELLTEGLIDGTDVADNLYKDKSWQFWSYLRGILEDLYGNADVGWDHIALTNIVKCNNSFTTDNTTELMKNACLSGNQFVWKEIEFLRPKSIVFFTSWGYDNFLEKYRIDKGYKNQTSRSHQVKCGARSLPWWVITDENSNIKILRTGHPERKKKDEFIKLVAGFIKSGID